MNKWKIFGFCWIGLIDIPVFIYDIFAKYFGVGFIFLCFGTIFWLVVLLGMD